MGPLIQYFNALSHDFLSFFYLFVCVSVHHACTMCEKDDYVPTASQPLVDTVSLYYVCLSHYQGHIKASGS